MLKITFVQRSI